MRHHLLLAAMLAMTLAGPAQTTPNELNAEPERAGGNYYGYPAPSGRQTPAPAGYEPFYISHYGRHGARYMSDDKDLKAAIAYLKRQQLNALGRKTLKRLLSIDSLMAGRTGELTPLGYDQLRGIASRMAANYPTAFESRRKITAKSTYVPRSIVSMSTFCLELQRTDSSLLITPIVSNRDMGMLNKDRVKNPLRPKIEDEMYKEYREFCKRNHPAGHRLANTLLAKPLAQPSREDDEFGEQLFHTACAEQCMPGGGTYLLDLFTPEERWRYWQARNAFWYSFCGMYEKPNRRAEEFGKALWEDIKKEADSALAGNGKCADLRFGHDTGLLPFLVYMGINAPISDTLRLENLHQGFADYKVIPMAANAQFVFYRNAAGKVLVKVLVNEEEASLPEKYGKGPYYEWEKVKLAHGN